MRFAVGHGGFEQAAVVVGIRDEADFHDFD
jgi:hypothetical protein